MDENEFREKYFHVATYWHKSNLKTTASNLWANGISIFKRAEIIMRFDDYKSISAGRSTPPNIDDISPFIFESIMDKTRIITCFENFMKGVLILNGYVVHVISKSKKGLKKRQENEPILATDLFTLSSFDNLEKKNLTDLETTWKTINFTTLLKPGYQSILMLPKPILHALTRLNEERNMLHFVRVINFEHSEQLIKMYSDLIDFVDRIMFQQFQLLDTEIQKIRQNQ